VNDDSTVIDIARLLLDAGADVNAGTFTPLHAAVLANVGNVNASTEVEEFLLSRGAKVFVQDEMKRLPLHYTFISQAEWVT